MGATRNGYGIINALDRRGIRHSHMHVHRAIFEATHGPIRAGMQICHHCDNRRCANPSHLFAGSAADNVRDKHTKHREARGEGHGMHKLMEEEVRLIRCLRKKRRYPLQDLAFLFGVHHSTISDIVLHPEKHWAHVSE